MTGTLMTRVEEIERRLGLLERHVKALDGLKGEIESLTRLTADLKFEVEQMQEV
jgi:hypothetical protein